MVSTFAKIVVGVAIAIPIAVLNILVFEAIFGSPFLPILPGDPIGAVLTAIGILVFTGLVIWEWGR